MFFFKAVILICMVGIYFTIIYGLSGIMHIFSSLVFLTALGLFIFTGVLFFVKGIKSKIVPEIIMSPAFVGMSFIFLYADLQPKMDDIPFIITGFICFLVSDVCLIQLPKRSRYGNKVYGQLLGFKKFLETAELPHIKQLAQETPNYCYDILPYLYIFDLSDKWMDKFGSLFKTPPEWYKGSSFRHTFKDFISAAKTNIIPSSSGGSSSGGGGHSGGGSGGGGGGSW